MSIITRYDELCRVLREIPHRVLDHRYEVASAIEVLKRERDEARAENERLLEVLMDATAHLAGAVSAYDKFRNKGATGDPFYKTRIADFNKALDRARLALGRKPQE